MSILEINQLTKCFESGEESLEIFKDLDLRVEAGTIITITGESGSGKSTLLNLIGGLDSITAGSINACGFDIDKMKENSMTDYRNRYLGLIFQFHFLLDEFNATENVMIPALIAGKSRKIAEKRAKELLDEVSLASRLDHYPSQLSGGERQRVATARALMNDPQLILADEPTGNLDAKNSEIVEEQLFGLVKKYNKTLLLVTHDHAEAARGDRCFNLNQGVLTEL